MSVYARAAIGLLISIAMMGYGWKCYVLGKQEIQRRWDAEKVASAIAAAEAEKKHQASADTVAKKIAKAARRERVVYRTLIKESAHVSPDCALPADVRVLHDAAVAAKLPDSGAARADAAPVSAQDLTETVIENYEACKDNERRLAALQELIKEYNGE